MPIPLSVLDQSPVAENSSGGEALRNSIDLAQLADDLGFERYWMAEHHQSPALACASPEVLIGPIAQATHRIRVGSGGIMLPHYSPLKVAETFSMLAGIFPDRIDLGLGRAPGTDQPTAFALQRDRRQRSPDDFSQQLDELLGYFSQPSDRLSHRRMLMPGRPNHPSPWLLGSSPQSAIWAAERGLPYVFADFINAAGSQFVPLYREHFKPSAWLQKPRVTVAAWAICADTDEEAIYLSSSFRMMMTLLHRGQLIAVPSPRKAMEFLSQEKISTTDLPPGRRAIVGSPATVRSGLESVAEEYGADELMLVNIMHDHAARRKSYELIADVFALTHAVV